MKALIIESDKNLFHIIQECFKDIGIDTIWAKSGEEALSIVDNNIKIVCSNYILEDMKGTEFSAELNIKLCCKNFPVILLLEHGNPDIYYEALISGFTDVFSLKNISEFKNYLFIFKKSFINSINNSRILLVEDSNSMARIIKKNLEFLGCVVTHFINGEDAFKNFKENDYDAVITDIVLPGYMSGLSLIRHIRNYNGNKKIVPILVITAFDDDSRRLEILKEGVTDYIKKPFKKEELEIRLQNILKNKCFLDELINAKSRLEETIIKDSLTGLYNRYFLLETGKKRVKEAKRQGYPLSLVVIDIDYFKKINDRHGHIMGDKILCEIAEILKKNFREEDIVARYGGEEFVLILPFCNEIDAFVKAEEIRRKIETLRPHGIYVTASFGIASLNGDKDINFENLFAMADMTMYEAKDKGRNMVFCYSYIITTNFLKSQ